MATLAENRRAWAVYHWYQDGDEWSRGWGTTAQLWYGSILPRIHPYLPCDHLVEIAPGHGRCTQYLHEHCRHLSVVDLVPECIAVCKKRFAQVARISYHVNDGLTLPMLKDGSVDFVFSWDSLVHAEADVLASYAAELARVLRPGGHGFLHHSNLGAVLAQLAGTAKSVNDCSRDASMSAEQFRAFCAAS